MAGPGRRSMRPRPELDWVTGSVPEPQNLHRAGIPRPWAGRALFGHLLHSLDDGPVHIQVDALGDLVGVSAPGVLSPRSAESALAQRAVGDAAMGVGGR